MSNSIVDNAVTLMNDPEALLSELQNEVQGLYEDLKKLRTKNNTTAGCRVRKSLMRLKKFADTGRKVAITDIKTIKGDRKSKRSQAGGSQDDNVPGAVVNDTQTSSDTPAATDAQDTPKPEPVATKKKSRRRKKKSSK